MLRFLRKLCFTKRLLNRLTCHMIIWVLIFLYIIVGIVKISRQHYGEIQLKLFTFDVTDTSTIGCLLIALLYFLNSFTFLSIPSTVISLLGILRYNPVFETKRGPLSTTTVPFVGFRVVTRGLFPNLVKNVTKHNIEVCQHIGLSNFRFEVVTDRALNLSKSHYIREIVVPESYQTPNGTLFKARALHYCLEKGVNELTDDDWIVHLDEETFLTERSVFGIVDFMSKSQADIGQGVITYGECEIENWLTTLLDGARTATDFGLHRFTFQVFKCPLFGFKGSYVVLKMKVEARVGFDFGPKESITEDLRFALTAWSYGYTFGFVEGKMREKSPFTITDFVKQRKRWFVGAFNILWGPNVPLYFKLGVFPNHIAKMLLWATVLNVVLMQLNVITFQLPMWHQTIVAIMGGSFSFMLAFGNFMSLSSERFSWEYRLLISFLTLLLLPLSGILDAYATVTGLLERGRVVFDIVQKEVKSTTHVINV